MKRTIFYLSLFFLMFTHYLFYGNDGIVKFIHLTCEIQRSGTNNYIPLTLRDKINTGDTIRTDKKSFIEIQISNGAVLRILPETTVEYRKMDITGVFLHLEGGYIVVKLPQNTSEQIIEITTRTAKIEAKQGNFKVYASHNSTTIICANGTIKYSSTLPEWQHIQPRRIGTTDKVILTNHINQTNAPILTATDEELFIDKDTVTDTQTELPEDNVKLKDFIRETKIIKTLEQDRRDAGFNFHSAFGGLQLDKKSYFLLSLRPEFFYKDFRVILNIPFYLDGYSKFYKSSKWGNSNEYDFKSTHDALYDLLVKIEYLGIGKKDSEYFVKFGNLEKFTWGNGFLVNNFSNDEAFPMVKRVGFYFETDFNYIGVQGFIHNINVADIQGYRIFFRPLYGKNIVLKNMQFGITTAFDTNPALNSRKNPSVFSVGLDMFFPVYAEENIKVYLLADILAQGFRFKDRAIRDIYSLPSNYDDEKAGISFLKGATYHFAGRVEYKSLTIETGFIHCTQGMVPQMFDTFYYIFRNKRSEYFLNKDLENYKLGGHVDFKITINKIFYIDLGYFFLKSNSNSGYEDKVKFSLGLIPGSIWKLHLKFIYEKLNFFRSSLTKIPGQALMHFECGVIWSENVSVIITARRFFDEYGTDFKIFMLETRLTF